MQTGNVNVLNTYITQRTSTEGYIHVLKDMDFIYTHIICLTTVLRKINESDIFILHTFVLF